MVLVDHMTLTTPTAQELVLEVFQALTSNTQIVKESILKGMWICLCCKITWIAPYEILFSGTL